MAIVSKYAYYLSSVPTLLSGLDKPWRTAAIFLGIPGAVPTEITLKREKWRFAVRSALDVWVIKETCLDKEYWPDLELNPNWTVVDIGAGLGDFTVLAAKSCPKGTIHAYEPHDGSYQLLKKNLELNQIQRVTCYPEAAGRAGQSLVTAGSRKEAVWSTFIETPDGSSVVTVNLTQILDRLPGRVCDLLKIDCEGCEYDFLLEADPESLARVRRITMEVHEGYSAHTTQQLLAFLRQNGFSVRHRSSPVHSFLHYIKAEH
jgi:FkbM family methyltransferase